ncbi:GNAT family N-acetyltransferase [Georgenia deserti]|uniref:GNAT family N-acetyltransferase n=1 Tax=Georgenia deserti TaxID=2093781 RepID=A0ABW4L241_9MICO
MTVTLVVGPAAPEEFDRLGEIGVRAYLTAAHTRASMSVEYAAVLRDVAGRNTGQDVVLAARAGQDVLGSVTLAPAGSPWADLAHEGETEIRMLAVDPAAQGRGAGEALLRAAETWAREEGYRALVLSVVGSQGRQRPHRLYERLGYRRATDRDYVGSWEPRPAMWCYVKDVTTTDRGA